MLDGIRQFVKRHMTPGSAPGAGARADAGDTVGGVADPGVDVTNPGVDVTNPVALAACALLLEVAHADGEFSEAERLHIENAVGRHFNLDGATTAELLRLADEERRTSIDHFQFTRVIAEEYDLGAKMVLAEILWGVILSDGKIAAHEEYLVRKIANLLQLEPGYLSEARRSARRPHFDP